MAKELIYIDLFSGVGGFAKGFSDAGANFAYHYFSEVDKDAIAVYKYQFNDATYIGNVTTVSGTRIREQHPEATIIVTFGFPCQDLSSAGKGEGINGARSGLFHEAIRIVKETHAEVFVFENVKGLLTNNEGRDFKHVLQTITDIGLYECEGQLLNTRWVLPQNRERIYFIGHLTGASSPEVFPFRKSDSEFNQQQGYFTESQVASTLQCPGNACGNYKGMNAVVQPVTSPRGNKKQNGRLIGDQGDPSFTLNTQDKHGVKIDKKIRRLTELECERLQGFPDNWTQYGNYNGTIKKVSATQRYKQMGNAVTTTWPKLIAQRLTIL